MNNNKLELLADDFLTQATLDALRQECKTDVEIYFDNSDIRSMVLGLRNFQFKINREKLESPQTLVHSLAYFGWVKNIRMLAPHQDELVDYLDKKYLLPIYTDKQADQDTINDLLHSVGLLHIDKLKELIDNDEIKQYLAQFKDHSVELFKVNYFIKDFNWLDRLKRVISFDSNAVVAIDESTYDLAAALRTSLFKKLIATFDVDRSEKGRNNFRDALALTLIKQKINDFSGGHVNSFPVFYATTFVIKKIRDKDEIHREFDVEVVVGDQKKVINVLRDSYFFVLDVLFNIVSSDKDVPMELFEKLSNLRKRFGNLSLDDITSTNHLDMELGELLFKDQFFFEFWFKKVDADVLSRFVSDLVSYDRFKTDVRIRRQIESEIAGIKVKLSRNLDKLHLTEDIWVNIGDLPRTVESIFSQTNNIKVFPQLAMIRFSLADLEDDIQGICQTIFDGRSKKAEYFYNMQVQLTNYVLNGLYEKRFDELLTGIAVFWIFGRYTLICEILELVEEGFGEHYQLALLHAAAIFASGGRDGSQVEQLLKKYEALAADGNDAALWVGLGFVYEQMWILGASPEMIPEDHTLALETDELDELEAVDEPWNGYGDKGILYTNNAYKWLTRNRNRSPAEALARNELYVYALNNLLYYKLRREENSKTKMAGWSKLAGDLILAKSQFPDFWQFRYDHTLALFEFRMYVIEQQMGSKDQDHLNKANGYIKDALKHAAVRKFDYDLLESRIKEKLKN